MAAKSPPSVTVGRGPAQEGDGVKAAEIVYERICPPEMVAEHGHVLGVEVEREVDEGEAAFLTVAPVKAPGDVFVIDHVCDVANEVALATVTYPVNLNNQRRPRARADVASISS